MAEPYFRHGVGAAAHSTAEFVAAPLPSWRKPCSAWAKVWGEGTKLSASTRRVRCNCAPGGGRPYNVVQIEKGEHGCAGTFRSVRGIVVSKKKQTAAPKKTVASLDARDCRWPIGDPRDEDFHFCGATQLAGRPYCEHHWRMAFQPSRDRSSAVVLPRLKAA